MSSVELAKSLAGIEDLLSDDTIVPVTQSRLDNTGLEGPYPVTPVNTASVKLSSTAKSALSLSGDKRIDDALLYFQSGGSLPDATVGGKGIGRVSVAPVSATIPIFVGDNDPRLVSAAAAAAANGASSPTAANPFITQNSLSDQPDLYGTGKDGAYILGTITTPATAVSGLSAVAGGGLVPAGTYSYKWTAGNITGETAMSSGSATVVLSATGTITGTIPTGSANTAWRRLYRDDGTSTWRLVKHIPNNTDTTFTDTLPVGGASTTLAATPSATWSNPSGEWHFNGDMTISSALSVASTGGSAGVLIIRCRGNVTISASVSAAGAYPSLSSGSLFYTALTGPQGTRGGDASYAGNANGRAGVGYGALVPQSWLQGAGGAGSNATTTAVAGTGGAPGGVVLIYAYGITVATGGSVSANGANGGNAAAGTGSYNASGGAGGAGGLAALVARDLVWIKSGATVSANGGNGGAGIGAGSTSIVGGAASGGGGYACVVAPVIRNDGTVSSNPGTPAVRVTTGGGGAGMGNGPAAGGFSGSGGGADALPASAGSGNSGTVGQVIIASVQTGLRNLPWI